MKEINVFLSASLAIVALIFGILVGYYISPTYQQTMYEKDDMGLGQADKFVDLRYINQMASHHMAAILLAEQIADKSKRNEIKSLASEIQTNEPKLIEELYTWKRDWYKDNRPVNNPSVPNIGTTADDKTDLRFLNALIAHHEEGIKMTKEIKLKSSRKETLDNAYAVEEFLTQSLITLKQWRTDWYGVK